MKDIAMQLETLNRKASADHETNWVTAGVMGMFHLGAVAALFFFTWKALFVAMFLWWVSGSLGIGMGYHRLLTHRGYKTPKWVEYFLTTCATLALEGGPFSGWPRTAFITSFLTTRGTRTRRSMASGGRTWVGS